MHLYGGGKSHICVCICFGVCVHIYLCAWDMVYETFVMRFLEFGVVGLLPVCFLLYFSYQFVSCVGFCFVWLLLLLDFMNFNLFFDFVYSFLLFFWLVICVWVDWNFVFSFFLFFCISLCFLLYFNLHTYLCLCH